MSRRRAVARVVREGASERSSSPEKEITTVNLMESGRGDHPTTIWESGCEKERRVRCPYREPAEEGGVELVLLGADLTPPAR